jgi:hypothetical protein
MKDISLDEKIKRRTIKKIKISASIIHPPEEAL